MENIVFITIKEVYYLHKGLIEEFGGIHGVRDEGLLDSAVNTPQASFSGQYLHPDIYEMGAAYAYHIIKNHPFIDGNKRTGIGICIIFFGKNDIIIKMVHKELYDLTIKIATSEISKKEIAEIFRRNTLKH